MAENQLAAAKLTPQAGDILKGLWASLFYTSEAPKSVLFCSSNPREGATTIACGLALAGSNGSDDGEANDESEMARSAGRVVLVDLNLRTPAVGNTLNVANGMGVSDVLVGKMDLSEAIQHVGPGKMDVLTAGSKCGKVLDILRADRVKSILDELQQRYDQIIIDVAPVNQYPDAQVLSEAVEAIVLVARCQHIHREALLQAKKRLQAGGGKIAGVVLNMRTYPIPRFVYRRV